MLYEIHYTRKYFIKPESNKLNKLLDYVFCNQKTLGVENYLLENQSRFPLQAIYYFKLIN